MKSAFFAIILFACAGSASAFETGHEFLKECEPGTQKAFTQLSDQEQLFGMGCAGYIKGLVGGIRLAEVGSGTKMICSPSGIEVLQAMKISVRWMNEHDDQLDKPAVGLIFRSLVEAFPCSESDSPQQKKNSEQDPNGDRLKL